MSVRNHVVLFIEDLARRHTDIGHKLSAIREERRFFEWANNDALKNNYALNNLGWNVILDMLPGRREDNKRESEWKHPRIALDFVTFVKPDDAPAERAALAAAEDLSEEFLKRMREICRNPCPAIEDGNVSPGITLPNAVLWETNRWVELSPLLFIGDRYFGFRQEVDLRYDVPNTDGNPAKWGAPA